MAVAALVTGAANLLFIWAPWVTARGWVALGPSVVGVGDAPRRLDCVTTRAAGQPVSMSEPSSRQVEVAVVGEPSSGTDSTSSVHDAALSSLLPSGDTVGVTFPDDQEHQLAHGEVVRCRHLAAEDDDAVGVGVRALDCDHVDVGDPELAGHLAVLFHGVDVQRLAAEVVRRRRTRCLRPSRGWSGRRLVWRRASSSCMRRAAGWRSPRWRRGLRTCCSSGLLG